MLNKIMIGTAQLGLDYGINNNSGKPNKEQAYNILHYAFDNNIRTLDTAEVYGDSQQVIGAFIKDNPSKKFNIITKIAPDYKSISGNFSDKILSTCKILNTSYSYNP